jgi:hypothetical protein
MAPFRDRSGLTDLQSASELTMASGECCFGDPPRAASVSGKKSLEVQKAATDALGLSWRQPSVSRTLSGAGGEGDDPLNLNMIEGCGVINGSPVRYLCHVSATVRRYGVDRL